MNGRFNENGSCCQLSFVIVSRDSRMNSYSKEELVDLLVVHGAADSNEHAARIVIPVTLPEQACSTHTILQSVKRSGATVHEGQGLLYPFQYITWPLGAEVHKQMSRSGALGDGIQQLSVWSRPQMSDSDATRFHGTLLTDHKATLRHWGTATSLDFLSPTLESISFVLKHIVISGSRWIRRGGPVNWPARSPDLSCLDFFLWSHMKSLVYASPVDSDEALVARVALVAGDIREMPGVFANVRQSLRRRFDRKIMYSHCTKSPSEERSIVLELEFARCFAERAH
ncbi:uncharacterized protein TNCV_2099781 [Trichonephila clavipes]|nr:uncharacterized protein TNCV_2099781 [Trichonephila clavipes]